jgi:predicted HTH domain antitoxin
MVDTIDLSYEEQRRTVLIHKLTQGTISLTEAHELRTLLERERHMLTQQGNCLAFFAVRFLIDYVDEYLQSKSNSLLASGS